MYTKIASVIEILLGLAMGGLVCFVWLIAASAPGPAAMGAFLVVPQMILLSIFLIIFGCKKVWLPSIVTLVIATALFTIMGLGYPIFYLGSIGAIICLILFILGKIFPARETKESLPKIQIEKKISIPWKKIFLSLKSVKSAINKHPKITILIIVILAIAGVCYFYKIPQRIFPSQPPGSTPSSEVIQPSEPEVISPETIPPGYEIYKHKIYGYDMLSSETPILEVIVFDDQNENGAMDSNEKGLQNIHLDESWGDMVYLGGMLAPENGIVNFNRFPLRQKITISLPTRDDKYWGWRTAFEEGWPVTTIDKYEFTLTEIPEETKTIYFGLKKIEEPAVPLIEEEPTQACVEVIKNGDPSGKINVVFIGDKYSSDEMDLFSSDVDKFIDKEGAHRGLLSIEPFKSYQNYFNFYRIDKAYEFGCEKHACSPSEVQSAAKMECPSLDELVVLSNYYEKGLQVGWSTPHFGVVERVHSTDIEKPLGYEQWEFFAQAAFVHEFGHSFGDLADEYTSTEAISRIDRANCDVKGCPKWCSGEIDTSKPCYQLIVKFENCIANGKSSQECSEEVEKEPGGSGIESCDIGVDCLEGTGCVWNCKGTNGYKPSNPYGPDRPYGWKEIPSKMLSPEQDVFCPVSQRHLIKVIENYKE